MLERRLYDEPVALRDFTEALQERETDFHDEVYTADVMEMDDEGLIRIKRGFDRTTEHPLQDQALNLIGSKLKIPPDYLRRCPADLRSKNVNFWLKNVGNKRMMIRFDRNEIRAVLSERYSPVSNKQIIDRIETYSHMMGYSSTDVNVRFEFTLIKMVCQVIYPEQETYNVGDISTIGLHLINSEVGFSSASVTGLIFRLCCKNGLIAPKVDYTWKRRHLAKKNRILVEMQNSVGTILDRLPVVLNQFNDTQNVIVPEPLNVLENLMNRFNLTKDQKKAVMERFMHLSVNNQYQLINLFTWVGSHDNRLNLDARQELQQIGGKLINFSPSELKELSVIKLEKAS